MTKTPTTRPETPVALLLCPAPALLLCSGLYSVLLCPTLFCFVLLCPTPALSFSVLLSPALSYSVLLCLLLFYSLPVLL